MEAGTRKRLNPAFQTSIARKVQRRNSIQNRLNTREKQEVERGEVLPDAGVVEEKSGI